VRNLRGTFDSRFGFYLAAIGSACGLGTLWRFPYVTGKNGGGAFGLPALISELMLGKLTRRNVVGALSWSAWGVEKSKWKWFGVLSLLASTIVLSYYTVISGWVIHFFIQSVLGRFTGVGAEPELVIDRLLSHGYLQILLASVHLIIITSIVAQGVQNGIEKSSKIFIPILLVVMGFLFMHSLFLPGAPEAFRFLFYPDFSKLTGTAVIEALGHALFTLSLGFGAMVAYGSYLRPEVHLPSEALFVACIDTLLSIVAGILTFSIVFSFHVDAATGPSLLFKTMPVLFGQLEFGYWVAIAFFISLYFAALSASIALFEGLVAYFMDQWHMSRPQASYRVAGSVIILAFISAFSGSLFKNIKLGERGIIEIIDQVIINWTIPIVALGLIIFVGRKIPESAKQAEFIDPKSLVTVRLYSTWRATVKYMVPILLVVLITVQFLVWFLKS
jgi:NSS family neurotransmitter:Na+ symporter